MKPGTNLLILSIAVFLTIVVSKQAHAWQIQTTPVRTAQEKQLVETFEKRAKEYINFREQIEAKIPKLSKEAKPEEIEAHKKDLQTRVQTARIGAKQGDIFTPEAAAFIRAKTKEEFKGKDRAELRKTVLVESETKAVPLRINYPYPETKEQLEMPPTLLLQLPQLPKQLRFRFVGHNLLLVDRENGLIIDYLTNALP